MTRKRRSYGKRPFAFFLTLILMLSFAFHSYASETGSVNVAVFDGGFNPSDAGLSAYVQGCYNAVTGLEGAESITNVEHGTSCAKILINTAAGLCQAFSLPFQLNLYLVQVDAEGTNSSYQASLKKGIAYAESKNCQLVSISLSDTQYHAETEELIRQATYGSGTGILFVASGGNSGTDEYRYPASYNNVLSVAPLNASATAIADAATHNDRIDLAAPGGNASAATPYAAAAAAILFMANPALTAPSCLQILTQTAVDAGDSGIDTSYGYGIIDPAAALNAVYYRLQLGQ